jgi:carbonic anhydrase
MQSYEKLLLQNKAWVKEKLAFDPDFFEELSQLQTPEFLWIGCADSRVPANEITNTAPGEIFVHRNVANLVVHTDLNVMSVIQYAVEVLKVKHIIVCGHYGCGGVKEATTQKPLGLIRQWLCGIKEVYQKHFKEMEQITDPNLRIDRLVELNVIEQAQNVAKTSMVQNAWKQYQRPAIHGWVYNLKEGLLKSLTTIQPNDSLESDIYEFEL